jgi:molybdate transport system substrate-binding protein
MPSGSHEHRRRPTTTGSTPSERKTMKRLLFATAILCAVLIVGCGHHRAPDREAVTLTVLCGGSFRPPMEELAKAFSTETRIAVELSFGQSEDLLPLIKIGREGDVFVSHDPYLDYVDDAGSLLSSAQVGYVAPVLVVPKGNPARVESLDDLARPGVRVALPDPEFSTCGQMVFKLLEKKGIKDKVVANADGAIFRSHSEIGTALEMGQRQAGVVWNGVAHTFRDSLEVVPTRYEYDDTVRVWVMGLSYTEHEASVRRFMEFAGKEGAAVFAKYGYVK